MQVKTGKHELFHQSSVLNILINRQALSWICNVISGKASTPFLKDYDTQNVLYFIEFCGIFRGQKKMASCSIQSTYECFFNKRNECSIFSCQLLSVRVGLLTHLASTMPVTFLCWLLLVSTRVGLVVKAVRVVELGEPGFNPDMNFLKVGK